MSLDKFLPPYTVKPKTTPKQEAIIVEEQCANPHCRKPIKPTDPRYTLNIKGKEAIFCPECARAKLLQKSGNKRIEEQEKQYDV